MNKTPEPLLEANRRYYLRHRERVQAMRAAYYARNKEALSARNKLWRIQNSDRVAAYEEARKETVAARDAARYQANKSKQLAANSAWHKANKDKVVARKAARRSMKLKACPAWADLEKIAAIYKAARVVERETGIKQNVDHVIPLKNKLVCGLHVETNLRIVPATENFKKKNKLIEELL